VKETNQKGKGRHVRFCWIQTSLSNVFFGKSLQPDEFYDSLFHCFQLFGWHRHRNNRSHGSFLKVRPSQVPRPLHQKFV
jgi:hypothetical protein